ncbi:MAG: hypothetical protein ACE5K0_12690, partial [Candidatus Methanofastidiosia archaeon]
GTAEIYVYEIVWGTRKFEDSAFGFLDVPPKNFDHCKIQNKEIILVLGENPIFVESFYSEVMI